MMTTAEPWRDRDAPLGTCCGHIQTAHNEHGCLLICCPCKAWVK